jgi:hypothetical protein
MTRRVAVPSLEGWAVALTQALNDNRKIKEQVVRRYLNPTASAEQLLGLLAEIREENRLLLERYGPDLED